MPGLMFHVCETGHGYVGIVVSSRGLRATTLPRQTADEALREAVEAGGTEPAPAEALGDLPERVSRLASGGSGEEAGPYIDWAEISPFRRAVLEEAMRIPAGETRSYGWLAAKVGRPGAARAVGRVMATNPLPLVVPCHRVVGSKGDLHGYGGGLEMKERLLRAEGALLGS